MAKKDHQRHLDNSHLNTDLKKRSLKSGAVTLTSQGMMFVIQLASTMILARILTPQDYGMMAMVVSITGLASILSNLGLSTATIQRAEITHEQVSTLFWINTAIGALVTVVIASLSPVVAWFYQTPELVWMMLALSSNFFINGMTVQHSALLNRQMKFYALAKIQVLSTLIGIVSAVVAAKYGLGYWALVINSVVTSVTSVIGTWFSSGWMPGMPRKSAEVKAMVKFGSDIVGFNVINYFSRNLDNILIGRYYGSGILGYYSKAYQLLMMPITNLRDPLQKVALPALSRLKDDPENYRNYFVKTVSILSFVSMPIVVSMFVFSYEIIVVFLGSQWGSSSDIFRILAFAALIQPASSLRGILLLSTGRSRGYLYLGLVSSLIVCCSFVFGLPWGAEGVALAYSCAVYLMLILTNFWIFKNSPVRVKDFFCGISRPLINSILSGVLVYILFKFIRIDSSLLVLMAGVVLFFSFYLFLYYFICGGRNVLKDYANYFRIVIGK